MIIRKMLPDDWNEVSRIYKEGIDTGHATFEKEVPSLEGWDKSHLKTCRFVAESEGEVAGWAALSPVSGRCVYEGVAEVSIYVSEKFRGQKIGKLLLENLVGESEKEGFWTLQAGIFPENHASLRLHKNLGFREVGFREKIGKMNGIWRDTILLERRTSKIK